MDDSEPSKVALEHAISLYPESDVTVLYVIDTTSAVGYGDLFTLAAESSHREERTEQLFTEAERIAAEHGTELTTVTERGVPARAIETFADDHGIDHIVMGSHCRTGFDRLFLGSVAERVVRHTPIPVTVVP